MNKIRFERIREFHAYGEKIPVDVLAVAGANAIFSGDEYIVKSDKGWRYGDSGESFLYHSRKYSIHRRGPADITHKGFTNLAVEFDCGRQFSAYLDEDTGVVSVYTQTHDCVGSCKLGDEIVISNGKLTVIRDDDFVTIGSATFSSDGGILSATLSDGVRVEGFKSTVSFVLESREFYAVYNRGDLDVYLVVDRTPTKTRTSLAGSGKLGEEIQLRVYEPKEAAS